MGRFKRQLDHGQPKTSVLRQMWAGLSLLGGLAALGMALFTDGGGAGDGGDGKPPDGSKPDDKKPEGGQPFRTFTDQKEFDAHSAAIRRQAERDALKTVAEQLGCSVDEAKQFLADRQAAEQAKLTEVERREQAAAKRESDAADREAAATLKAQVADVSLCLTTTGVRPDRVTYATNAVMQDLPADADAEAITAKVAAVKEAIPEFFGAAGEQKPPTPNFGGAPRNNGSGGARPTGIEAGRERARKARESHKPADDQADPFAGLGRVVGA